MKSNKKKKLIKERDRRAQRSKWWTKQRLVFTGERGEDQTKEKKNKDLTSEDQWHMGLLIIVDLIFVTSDSKLYKKSKKKWKKKNKNKNNQLH